MRVCDIQESSQYNPTTPPHTPDTTHTLTKQITPAQTGGFVPRGWFIVVTALCVIKQHPLQEYLLILSPCSPDAATGRLHSPRNDDHQPPLPPPRPTAVVPVPVPSYRRNTTTTVRSSYFLRSELIGGGFLASIKHEPYMKVGWHHMKGWLRPNRVGRGVTVFDLSMAC